jgi:hypothetical protein
VETTDKTIKQAFEIVKDKGEKYKNKREIYYFEGCCKNYCEDCIDKITKDRKRRGKCVEYLTEYGPEYDDFLLCDNCGAIIETSILWSDQEIDHWSNLDDKELGESLSHSYSAYCLMKIFDSIYGAVKEYPDETSLLAKKVINVSNKDKDRRNVLLDRNENYKEERDERV